MRLIYVIFEIVLAAAAIKSAPPQAPPVVPEKAPPVESGVITWHEVTWPDVNGRQAKWLVCSIPNKSWEFKGYVAAEVATKSPFPQTFRATSTTTARPAATSHPQGAAPGSSKATLKTTTYTVAQSANSAGGTNCPTFR